MDVKICGIRTEEALDTAIEAGAAFVGFVFFAKSPRNVDVTTAAALARRARERSAAKAVALVVDAGDAALAAIASAMAPDAIQLHGHESVERTEIIARRFGGTGGSRIWKAVAVATAADVAAAGQYWQPGRLADLILFDAKPPPGPQALPGGNGLAFDWRILEGLAGRIPFALAGGLTPENVADAIRLTHPDIVDVSSGVERAPGLKDPALIRRFIRAAKGAKGGENVSGEG